MNVNKNRVFTAISLSVIGITAVASSVDIPNTFTSGTPALVSEVNANFDAVETAIDDNDARIADIETQNADMQAQIDALQAIVDLA